MIHVIKIGSSSLYEDGPRDDVFDSIASQVSKLVQNDKVVIVSSGAIAFSKKIVGKSENQTVPQKQALASIGQIELLKKWQEAFDKHNQNVGQVLVTNEVLKKRHSGQVSHLKDTFSELFKKGIVPIVNENDAVAVEEIVQGDNDKLSALIANIIEADNLYILGKTNAIYEDYKNKSGKLKAVSLENIDLLRKISQGTDDPQATGGMITKIDASEIFLSEQNDDNTKNVFIGKSDEKDIVSKLVDMQKGTKITLI